MFTLQPTPVVVDTTVNLVCDVAGDTPIFIVWEHILANGSAVEVFAGNDKTGGRIGLRINMDGYGVYRCNGSSYFGMDSSSIDVVQAGESISLKSVFWHFSRCVKDTVLYVLCSWPTLQFYC